MSIVRAFLGGLGVAVVAVACGGSDDGSAIAPGASSPPLAPGRTDPAPETPAGSTVTPASACATSSANGEALPVYLVFMYDRSGSMKNDSKWSSAKAGMQAFFADPSTKGLFASLTFFAQPAPNECTAESYAVPAVPMAPLPDASSFVSVLDGVVPGAVGGGTPTLPAAKGAVQLAQSVAAQHAKDGRVAIVLVTDGEPNGCGSTPENVAAELAKVKDVIPTYVIGVGSEVQNLDTIAAGGGTAPAIRVATNDPGQTTKDFTSALNAIKQHAVSCDYVVPSPPNGQVLDPSAVNVSITATGGSPATLPYDPACAGGVGWHYDDATAPTRIVMCSTSCDSLKAAPAKVDIFFGCKTAVAVR